MMHLLASDSNSMKTQSQTPILFDESIANSNLNLSNNKVIINNFENEHKLIQNEIESKNSNSNIIENQENDNNNQNEIKNDNESELADRIAVQLQNQLKNYKFESNDSISDDDDFPSRKRKFRAINDDDTSPKKKPKLAAPEFIIPELSEEALKLYYDKRKSNFPTRDKLKKEVEERWTRIERGEIIWEDFSRNQWQLNQENDNMKSIDHQRDQRQAYPFNPMESPSLLENILKSDQERETSIILQIIRYFVHHRFFFQEHELKPDILDQLKNLEERTKQEIVSHIATLKKRFPRDEDIIETLSELSDSASNSSEEDSDETNELGEDFTDEALESILKIQATESSLQNPFNVDRSQEINKTKEKKGSNDTIFESRNQRNNDYNSNKNSYKRGNSGMRKFSENHFRGRRNQRGSGPTRPSL